MSEQKAAAKGTVLCTKRDFSEVMNLSWGIISVLTLGLGYLFLRWMYALVPEELVVRDNQLFGGSRLPTNGVALNAIKRVEHRSIWFTPLFKVARTLHVFIEDGGRTYVINNKYFPREEVDRTIEFFRTVAETPAAKSDLTAVAQAPSKPRRPAGRAVLKGFAALMVLGGLGFSVALQLTTIKEESTHLRRLQHLMETPADRAAYETPDQLQTWHDRTSDKLRSLRTYQGLALGLAGLGVIGVLALRGRR